MLQNGIIEPSVSLWVSPVVLVKKPDKTFRLCIDYRSLDKATIKDSYALPNIQDTLDTLHGNNLFTTLDLLKGCHQIKVEESSCEKIGKFVILYINDILIFSSTFEDHSVMWHKSYKSSKRHTSRYELTNASLLGILLSFLPTSLPSMELDLKKGI